METTAESVESLKQVLDQQRTKAGDLKKSTTSKLSYELSKPTKGFVSAGTPRQIAAIQSPMFYAREKETYQFVDGVPFFSVYDEPAATVDGTKLVFVKVGGGLAKLLAESVLGAIEDRVKLNCKQLRGKEASGARGVHRQVDGTKLDPGYADALQQACGSLEPLLHPDGAFRPFAVTCREKTARCGVSSMPLWLYPQAVMAVDSELLVSVINMDVVMRHKGFSKIDKWHEVLDEKDMKKKGLAKISIVQRRCFGGSFRPHPVGDTGFRCHGSFCSGAVDVEDVVGGR